MRGVLVGVALGAAWVVWMFLAVDWWDAHVTPRITRWVYHRAERRLVRTGRFTPEEARETVASWGTGNGSRGES